MIDKELLRSEAEKIGIVLNDEALNRFDRYAEILVEWNEKMNLTAITEPKEIVIRHFIDSLTALNALEIPQGASLIDVGTGAGFPALPLKIARPDLKVTLLDSLNKRITFLNAAADAIGVQVRAIHGRAEESGRMPQLREKFDVATARAVALLPVISEYCIPFVKVGGAFLAMKGPDRGEEIDSARKAVATLGAKIESVTETSLPDGSGRTLIVCRKTSPTPAAYPRHGSKISKKSL